MVQSEPLDASTSNEKPSIRPKSAKRPSTASLTAEEPQVAEGIPMALGAPAGVVTGQETRSVESNETDPSRVVPTTNGNASSAVSAAVSPVSKEEDKTVSTAPTTAASSQTVGSKQLPATTSPSSPATTSAPKPSTSTAPPTTTSRAAPSTSKPTITAKTPKKKRKGGPFAFLFACVPCISDPGHDDSHETSKIDKRPVATPAPVVKKESEKVVQPEPPAVQSSTSSTDEKVATPIEPESAITPPATEPLAAASPSTPIAAPPPSSSPSPQGVTLPREETEGVTSGAVVPPGQAAPLTSPAVVAPKSRRKRSGKHPNAGTDGIITSVPEPGARQGGILMAGGDSESSEEGSEEDDEDDYQEEEEEEDEEQGLIARGGVGIPIGEDGLPHPLLDELSHDLKGRKCLVLDLDETLVHSSFKVNTLFLSLARPGSLLTHYVLLLSTDGASSRLRRSCRD